MRHARFAFLAWLGSLAIAGSAAAFTLWPFDLPRRPVLYNIEGTLDRAPEGGRVLDRIDITTDGQKRELLVSRYGTPGETMLDEHLSRNMLRRYVIRGRKEDVARIFALPPGGEIAGKFLVYTDGVPWMMISELERPPAE